MTAPPVWRIARTADGSPTLLHPEHGEACHSTSGAWTEARERHVRACDIPARLARGGVLRVLDVGTGAGLSLAALLEAAEEVRGSVRVTTLELDPLVLDAARALAEAESSDLSWAGPLRRVVAALAAARSDPAGDGGAGEAPFADAGVLRLVLGDARRTLPRLPDGERFDAVFLDPFSPGVDPALWEVPFLAQIARRMAPGSILSTYSAATSVRAGLLAAGLTVRAGPRVGAKREGTLAGPLLAGQALPPRVERRLVRRAAALAPRGETQPAPAAPPAAAPTGARNPEQSSHRSPPSMA